MMITSSKSIESDDFCDCSSSSSISSSNEPSEATTDATYSLFIQIAE